MEFNAGDITNLANKRHSQICQESESKKSKQTYEKSSKLYIELGMLAEQAFKKLFKLKMIEP